MKPRPTLVIFQGGARLSDTPLESYVLEAQTAATLDLLSLAAESDAFERALLVTEDPMLVGEAEKLSGVLSLTIERGGEPFHFGEALRRVCEVHRLERVVYAGGASLPLATRWLLRELAVPVSGEGECVVANSLFSADFVAFYPAGALARIPLPAADNNLAWLLHYTAGLPFAPTPRTIASQFDIDTPPDLAVLNRAYESKGDWAGSNYASTMSAVGKRLGRVLERVPAMVPRLAEKLGQAYEVMATRRAQVLLAGRVSAWVWRRLEVNLPCQTRVLSEERGLQASGREARGEARSLLGLLIDALGVEGLVNALEETCDAAFLDTRVLFAHRRLLVSRADRFYSDALQPDKVSHPWVRQLTAALMSARIPIVLGGHSLVAGGIWALSERIRASPSDAPS